MPEILGERMRMRKEQSRDAGLGDPRTLREIIGLCRARNIAIGTFRRVLRGSCMSDGIVLGRKRELTRRKHPHNHRNVFWALFCQLIFHDLSSD
jgi:hypothetical protein